MSLSFPSFLQKPEYCAAYLVERSWPSWTFSHRKHLLNLCSRVHFWLWILSARFISSLVRPTKMKLSSYTSLPIGLALAISRAQCSALPRTCDVGHRVNTTSGIILGHPAANRTEVSEYLGIPFAQPPLGSLRFAAPEPYRSSSTFNASSYGLMCTRNAAQADYSILTAAGYHLTPTAEDYLNTIQGQGYDMGEDCLTLNVWTKPQVGEKAKAVLLFVHGGGMRRHASPGSRNFCLVLVLTSSRFPGRFFS